MTDSGTNTNLSQVVELTVRLENLANVVEKLVEGNEGTVRTRGMKERITVAEYNIESNKQAYKDVQETIKTVEERLGSVLNKAILDMKTMFSSSLKDIEQKLDDKIATVKVQSDTQNTFLMKLKPAFTVISWMAIVSGGILIQMFLTGKLTFVVNP